ncbi:MAG: SRPBCC family protein [Gemmatimonadota bacterium]
MATKLETAQVSLPSDSEVSVSRSFDAPAALVYRAYTEPALMQRWLLGPDGWTMPVCEMDVRVGGRYRWRWRSAGDGSEFGFHGEFLEVAPEARLRHTEVFDPGDTGHDMGDEPAVVTVTFDERDGVTTVTTLVDYGTKASRDAALGTGMTDGMEVSYKNLDALLAKGAG